MDFQDVAKYSHDELTVPAEELPAGVDPSCREVGQGSRGGKTCTCVLHMHTCKNSRGHGSAFILLKVLTVSDMLCQILVS